MRKVSVFLINLILVLSLLMPVSASNIDFSANEAYYANLCSSAEASDYSESSRCRA